jgi:hypothetical protein
VELVEKLQLRDPSRLAVMHAPAGISLNLPGQTVSADEVASADAILTFVPDAASLHHCAPAFVAALRDRLVWIAYPKAGQLGTDLNRDSLTGLLRQFGLRPVRQVAIDDVWSALRIRAVRPATDDAATPVDGDTG